MRHRRRTPEMRTPPRAGGEAGARTGPQGGAALLSALLLLLVLLGAAVSLVWFMNQQQVGAGARHRAGVALAAAEAGVQRALTVLESAAPDGGPGREWRPTAHAEAYRAGPLAGTFTLSLSDDADGAVIVVSAGEVGGIRRRVRARVYLASPALLAALYGAGTVRLESPPAAVVILPYGAGLGDRPWVHVAAGGELWFATPQVSINDPAARVELGPGPVDAPGGPPEPPAPGPIRVLLARNARLTLGSGRTSVDVQQLRTAGVVIEAVVARTEALPAMPAVDREFYRALAAANRANAALNELAGRHHGDEALARKTDSAYSAPEFAQVQAYLKAASRHEPFRGVIYVRGGVELLEGQRIRIADGALVAESTVHLIEGSSLEVAHSAATRTLPGIIVLDNGALVLTQGAALRVHGLVYAGRAIDVGGGARVEIVGAVLAADPVHSFRNLASRVVIRYDPAVLGTPGLRVARTAPVVAWVAAWEELGP